MKENTVWILTYMLLVAAFAYVIGWVSGELVCRCNQHPGGPPPSLFQSSLFTPSRISYSSLAKMRSSYGTSPAHFILAGPFL
jgi:hypothetical protein